MHSEDSLGLEGRHPWFDSTMPKVVTQILHHISVLWTPQFNCTLHTTYQYHTTWTWSSQKFQEVSPTTVARLFFLPPTRCVTWVASPVVGEASQVGCLSTLGTWVGCRRRWCHRASWMDFFTQTNGNFTEIHRAKRKIKNTAHKILPNMKTPGVTVLC